jgi:UDP:flavonoid glycosyltransferase YjiC (YdhE family)
MRKLLFTTLPSNDLGLLTRSLPVAAELAQRGYQVAFCSPGAAPSRLIAEASFENLLPRHPLYYLLTATPGARNLYRVLKAGRRDLGGLSNFFVQLVQGLPRRFVRPTSQVWDMDHLAALSGMLSENYVRTSCEAMKGLIVDWDADAVVDFCNPFACMAAKALGKPLVAILQADMHPASQGFMWWKERPPNLPTPVPVLNKLLAEYGLEPINKTDELLVGDLTLVVGMPETDPLPAAADVTYVGPMLWQKPGSRLPNWVGDLNTDKPVIWVYSGNPRYFPGVRSPVDSAAVLHACIATLAEQDVQVVLTTGHHPLPKEMLPLPSNFHFTSFVPGLAMAERSDLLVHHGGYGSCQTGLYSGTPAVIIPTYSERESNARRVAAVGAGDYVVPVEKGRGKKHVPLEELQNKIRNVLADPGYTTRARLMGERLRAFGGAPEAARLIERFIQSQGIASTEEGYKI